MKAIFTYILILFSVNLSAQSEAKGLHLHKRIDMRAILAKRPSIAQGFSTVSEARSIINEIMESVDMQQNFQVVSTSQVPNAAAVTYGGTRYILYNPSFINQLDNAANDKWASISVLGHEIGHHLLGHTMDGTGSQIPKELRADEFSGLVLRRMGASLRQAQLAMSLIGSPEASATHPAERDRLAAIAKGWNSTNVQTNRNTNDVVINTPTEERRPTYPNSRTYPSNERTYPQQPNDRSTYPNTGRGSGRTNRSRIPESERPNARRYPNNSTRQGSSVSENIVYDIRFTGSAARQYFITTQNNVIMLRGNQAVVVAKVTATNRSNYPYVIYDDQQQIYIDTRGNLLLQNGRKVGYITRHL